MGKKDWQVLAAVATVGTAVVGIHGLTTKKWTQAHTFFAILGLIAYVGPKLA